MTIRSERIESPQLTDLTEKIKAYGLTPQQYEDCLYDAYKKANHIIDLDWQEIVDKYGLGIHYDTLRKATQTIFGGAFVSEYFKAKRANQEGDTYLDELRAEKIEVQKERQKFYDQRREFNKLVSSAGRQEHLYEVLESSASQLNETVGKLYSDNTHNNGYSDNEAVLVFTDWHYGMVTSNIFNDYNTDICKRRVTKVVESAKKRLVLHQCSKLHIVILGDLFHGAIHTSARVASEELVCDQIMQVSEILAQSVGELSQYVKSVNVYMTYGNHGRTIQNKKDNIHRDNMERLIPWWLKERLTNMGADNVCVNDNFENEFLFIDVAGYGICASHGDLDNVKTSPRVLSTLFQKKYGEEIDYILLGDKHHRESFEEFGITAQICGGLCGSDDYANDKRLYSTPYQLLLIFNGVDGVDAEYHIKCE